MSEKDLAASIKCAQSTMHDLLNSPEARHSSLVPDVHRVLKWPPPGEPDPGAPIFSRDALELARMFDLLPEEVRRSLKDQATAIVSILGRKPENQ